MTPCQRLPILSLLLFVTGCAGLQVAEAGEALALSATLRGPAIHNTVRCTARGGASGSKMINPDVADSIMVGQNKLRIPAGALSQPEMLNMVVIGGPIQRIRVIPQGKETLTFRTPVELEMPVGGCSPTPPNTSQSLFFSQENPVTGLLQRNEIVRTNGELATIRTEHLSFFTLAEP